MHSAPRAGLLDVPQHARLNEWKQYTVAWDELEQYGWGEPATFAGIANSLLWINDGPVESFEFAVDEVRLVGGAR